MIKRVRFARVLLLNCALAGPISAQTPTTPANGVLIPGATPDSAPDHTSQAFLDAAGPPVRPPENLLAREGVDAAPPAGFHPFQRIESTSDGAYRMYRSSSGNRVIVIMAMDAFTLWHDGNRGRRGVLEGMMNGHESTNSAFSIREDSTHIIWEAPMVEPDGRRGIQRAYMSRVGPPAILQIAVQDDGDAPDPATDPAIRAFLDAARPSNAARQPAPVTFCQQGVEIVLPPGIGPPISRSDSEAGTHIFVSRSENRNIVIIIIENREAGASRWPPERRLRHLHRWMGTVIEHSAPRMEGATQVQGDLAWNNFRFSRMYDTRGVAGRGRIYSTQSGPHRMIAVMYLETDSDQIADEAAITAMLDSVRVLTPR